MRLVNRGNSLAAGLVIIFLAVGLLGCGSGQEEKKPPYGAKPTATMAKAKATPTSTAVPRAEERKAEPTKAEAKVLPADFATRVVNAKDFFEWYDLREQYRASGAGNLAAQAALKQKEEELLKASPPKSVTKGLELVAFDWKRLEEAAPTEMAKYRFRGLLRSTEYPSISPDQIIRPALRGYPKTEHVQVLIRDGFESPYRKGQPPAFWEKWSVFVPPIQQWVAGTIVPLEISIEVPRLAYRLELVLARNAKTGTYLGRYGIHSLGWVED